MVLFRIYFGINLRVISTGFFTVNATTGSNMYFWFFPAQSGDANAPVVVWLQGGPGASSLFGLFGEIGKHFFIKKTRSAS